ncbi:MAG: metalloregulator ArsR/SmtB family transcription factor [Nitrospinota bacterium]|nr:metalloregulator ArsR/SmtB family transcription factor [Nitrospinota bacterium]
MRPDKNSQDRYDALARILKALAHPTRLFLVEQLKDGEKCVCELQTLVNANISTVSRHLAILRNAGIVFDDRRGSKVFYSLRSRQAIDLLSGLSDMAREDAESLLVSLK